MTTWIAVCRSIITCALCVATNLANAQNCPTKLSLDAYTTRCTGKNASYKRITYSDCRPEEKPAISMSEQITTLIEHLRCEVGDRVKITSAYRSEQHNLYSWAYISAITGDESIVAKTSKHRLGKAVDFYVEGASFDEHKAIEKKLKSWAGSFAKPLRGSIDKIWTKTYRESEGRDPDNQHPYPYLHVETRE